MSSQVLLPSLPVVPLPGGVQEQEEVVNAAAAEVDGAALLKFKIYFFPPYFLYRETTHGHRFFRRGDEEFFSLYAWVKNASRGGDVFGCHSLGEGDGGWGGFIFKWRQNETILYNFDMVNGTTSQ